MGRRAAKAVVMEMPREDLPPPEVTPDEEPEVPESSPDAPAPRSAKTRISRDGRALLREGFAAIGLDRAKGNALADWLDRYPHAAVTITGKVPEPPLRVFGTPDQAPQVDRRAEPE